MQKVTLRCEGYKAKADKQPACAQSNANNLAKQYDHIGALNKESEEVQRITYEQKYPPLPIPRGQGAHEWEGNQRFFLPDPVGFHAANGW